GSVMAKGGFRLIDAEMHVMEPVDLWQRYIDPEFRDRAPRRLDERRWDIRTLVDGEVMAQIPGGDWPALSDAEERAMAERYAEEIARDFDPESQVKAMDKEGLDLAILFPTAAMYATAFTRMDPRFARLRVAFLEAQCGWLPFWLGRMDEHYEWREPFGEMTHLTMPPSEYFRRQGFCAVECDEEFVSHVVAAFGDDNLVTTTDYPHGDSKYPGSMDRFLTLPLSDSSKRKILWDNAVRLYAL